MAVHEIITAVVLTVTSILYAVGLRALWSHAGVGQGVSRWQAAAFAAGNLSLAVALLSPLARLAERLFSAHMTQHEILMLFAAPLLAMSQPVVAMLWAFAPGNRSALARFVRPPSLQPAWRHATSPFAVFALHAAVLWVWHIPALYEAAMGHDGIHVFQHVTFVATAALFWWGMVHGRYGRAGYGVAVLYVFLTAVHSSILGALATVADRVWYPRYAATAAVDHHDALVDQQLAGLIMWIPSGVIFIVVGLALLAAWLGESERRANLSNASARS